MMMENGSHVSVRGVGTVDRVAEERATCPFY
jgi:hypothetical protein